jgi:hypothetical protein
MKMRSVRVLKAQSAAPWVRDAKGKRELEMVRYGTQEQSGDVVRFIRKRSEPCDLDAYA